ncbi:hypothetical protein [Nonomuraea soli]|uniref:Uncharacterized protein n=1 Tax=Nonomuraea soli TaxID=1032476 RepID=A0A7W0CD06_9ACTN|nr:hypothetical protein [Nonomuraea soli]
MRSPHCVGRHVVFDPGIWYPAVPRTDRLRVRDHSCSCGVVIYELCEAGGLQFIRRIRPGNGQTVVEESGREIASKIGPLWARMLQGET